MTFLIPKMGVGVRLVLLLACVHSSIGQVWEDPFFEELKDPIPELEYGEMLASGKIINLDEEVDASEADPVILIEIAYQGTEEIQHLVTSGPAVLLGAKIIKQNGKSYVGITERQNYEVENMQRYTIRIVIGSVSKSIFLVIRNIDDNRPIIDVSTCLVPELYVGKTNCTYGVYDEDGDISTDHMVFSIEGPEQDALFAIQAVKVDSYNINAHLLTKVPLDYAVSQLHIFTLKATDTGPNVGSATATVQVINVESRPPVWKTIFSIQKFPEKTPVSYQVQALDGDTGINKTINYRLKNVDERIKENVTIDQASGVLQVTYIDRDFLNDEVFTLDIGAYKFDNISWETESSVVLIVEDINDNVPTFNLNEFSKSILEETYELIDFEIIIEDLDLGLNGTYSVELINFTPPKAEAAFLIVPNSGYQKQDFQITIKNASLLDFDDDDFQPNGMVNFEIKAIERTDSTHVGVSSVKIELINWNDEVPIFENTSVHVTLLETVPMNTFVATMLATDRDVGDRVVHSLVGVNKFLAIDSLTGNITVAIDDAFDYQRQNEIIIQVLATDTLGEPYNTAYAQLTINLIDVNNKPPEIRMPRVTPEVEEHIADTFLITDEVLGSDPDSDAKIVFSINWDASYATKQGRRTDSAEYTGCINIETVYPNADDEGNAHARLRPKTMDNGKTIDFEKFEVLYLVIKLTDLNQEIGSGTVESTLTITIIDINDNPPVWVNGTLSAKRFVREEADSGTVIGSIQATDEDGPEFNEITYSIKAINGTKENLVLVDPQSGQLEVDLHKEIDADIPKTYFLYYEVIASDCKPSTWEKCYNTTNKIEIDITDTNNKDPFTLETEFNETIYIYENETTGADVVTLKSYDYDRDVAYSKVVYKIDYALYPELRKYFSVDLNTGSIIVDLQDGAVLDRDDPTTATHDIHLVLSDNYEFAGDRVVRENRTIVYVILLDVNDNAPQLPPSNTYNWLVSENATKGVELKPRVIAPDIDEPDTDNSRVRYEVLGIEAIQTRPPFPEDLFDILSPDDVHGDVVTNHPMKGYWGTYSIWIRAYDLGIPTMSTNETYTITVTPFNYMAPQFVFPINGAVIRLAKENVVAGQTLYTTSGKELDLFSAKDEDGLEAGVVDFDIVGDDEAVEYFDIINQEDNKGKLILKKKFEENTSFKVTIRAKDRGTDPGSLQSDITISVVFVSTQGQPVYDIKTQTVRFKESEEGLQEYAFLKNATDPRNEDCEGEECVPIFYHIVDGNQRNLFKLNSTENILMLNNKLNRTETDKHTIRIAANNDASPPSLPINPDSILVVTIDVREENPKPNFTQDVYTAGIYATDVIGKELIKLGATHSEELPITYSIKAGSITVTDSSLADVKDTAFTLDPVSGELNLNFRPTNNMKGIFTFIVIATDSTNKIDEAECKVFLVADNNKVSFIFDNELKKVDSEQDFIARTFTNNFKLLCNIDTLRVADDNGIPINNKTEIITHFIDPETELAVEAKQVEDLKSNVLLMATLQNEFSTKDLVLSGFASTNPDNKSDDLAKTLQIILIVVSTVLGTLCIVLLVAYCIRTRSLNQRLKALSTTKFGSQSSDMNRIGVAVVPGTNKHAIEGSNPVWNEEINTPQFDQTSVTSGDSDLIGIEEDPQFEYSGGGNGKK